MAKKVIFGFGIITLLLSILIWFIIYGNGTSFQENQRTIIFTSTTDKNEIIGKLATEDCIQNEFLFELLANKLNVFEKLKPGRFLIKKGCTPLELARMLRNNKQSNVKLVINKIRTLNDFAKLIHKNFDKDTITIVNELNNFFTTNNLGITHINFQSFIIPNTYEFYWNTSIEKLMTNLYNESENFWQQNGRLEQLKQLNLTKTQLITLASIVEEETNYNPEKGNIASVYLNRIDRKMKLGADPTIKFALNSFGLKRILNTHLKVESPYNTYLNYGLPPGPICTPSIKSIDASLNPPTTNYLFFVANEALNGTHHFTTNYTEHEAYAKRYREAITKLQAKKP